MQRHSLKSYAKEHGFEIVGSCSDIGSGLTMDRPGLLGFHAAAEDGTTNVLLVLKLSHLGRDVDKVTKYWHLLRDFGVSIHTADCDEIDLNFDTRLRGMIEEMRKRPR
uniref:recombinase family protein n=1 Tax=Enterocloster clostridioformis TaxID=1531 RepID=UPI0025A6863E|nr:recombinase family protein [Enterocloster clostridioformis]